MTTLQPTLELSDDVSDIALSASERRAIGRVRVQHAAYDEIIKLWIEREQQGCTQLDIAGFLDRNPSWVCRALAGPANWTLGTLGELAEALDALVEIKVLDRTKLVPENYNIYDDVIYGVPHTICPITNYVPVSRSVTVPVGQFHANEHVTQTVKVQDLMVDG